MKIKNIQLNETSLILNCVDGKALEYNYLWLRDNCSTAFHPITKERTFDLLSVSDNVRPSECTFNDDQLEIVWSEHDHRSVYDLTWLEQHHYTDSFDAFLMMPEPQLWDSSITVPTAQYEDLIKDDKALYEWLGTMARYGLSLVNNMSDEDNAMEQVAERLGHLRRTNFGIIFNVRSKPNPINQAYTAERLPLHTDLPNQEIPPGYQFLHCLNNESQGGESVFVDGFSATRQLKQDNPYYFELLSTHKIPFRFHDDTCDIRAMQPIISVVDGEVNEIIFNAHIADTFNLALDIVQDFYLAYRALIRLLNDPRFLIEFKLDSHQMVVFDNRRVLHGRAEFDPQTGARHLRGCYVDRTEFKSKYRILSAQLA